MPPDHNLQQCFNEVLEKYIDAKCFSEGVDKQKVKAQLPSGYSIKDVDMVVEKLSDEKIRFNKLPISVNSIKLENASNGDTSEDAQTLRILGGVRL